MADITMCTATGCDKKTTCYRFLATPGMRQSVFMDTPLKEDKSCDYYWKVDNKNE